MKLLTLAEARQRAQHTLAMGHDARESASASELSIEWLIEKVTGLNRSAQRREPHTLLTETQQQQLLGLIERCASGEPLAYVLGEWGFWTLQLHVTPAVLIPRPETELVVARALKHLPVDQPTRVLDLGTGSGAIALAIASERPLSSVLGTDMSAAALQVAQTNAERLGLKHAQFKASEWFDNLQGLSFDVIASNPPYIADDDTDVEVAVHRYEPHGALYSGPSGLDALTTITQHAPKFLSPGGWLVLEHGWQQAEKVRHLLESSGFSGVASHADLAGHLRVTEGQWLAAG